MKQPKPVLTASAEVIEANTLGYYANFRNLPNAEFHEEAQVHWIATNVLFDLFNGVLWAGFEPPSIDTEIERIINQFRRRDVPMIWHIGPSTRPVDLGGYLLRHGLTHIEDEPGMAVDLNETHEDVSPVTGLTIVPVEDAAMLRQWIDVWSFPLPPAVNQQLTDAYAQLGFAPDRPLRHYLGLLDGKPVATSAIFEAAGVASVQYVVTLPEARRQGIGAAMTVHVLREARARGYRITVLTSSPDGINIYRRIGFREYCTISAYLWEPSR